MHERAPFHESYSVDYKLLAHSEHVPPLMPGRGLSRRLNLQGCEGPNSQLLLAVFGCLFAQKRMDPLMVLFFLCVGTIHIKSLGEGASTCACGGDEGKGEH
eukprot:scaffold305105_cov23-Tisochrysis_lutea.AAC.1